MSSLVRETIALTNIHRWDLEGALDGMPSPAAILDTVLRSSSW